MMQAFIPPASFFFVRNFSGRESSQAPIQDVHIPPEESPHLIVSRLFVVRIDHIGPATESRIAHLSLLYHPRKRSAWLSKDTAARVFRHSSVRWPAKSLRLPRRRLAWWACAVLCSWTIATRPWNSSASCIKQFPQDPDVLFVVVHAYSDLSTRTAQDLGRTAPQSFAAHKLNAEALEMQGKWEPAQMEYEWMIQKEPNTPGIHFLLGRLLLSRPDAGPDATERAKQEFLKEIQIDPNNAGAIYILGELDRRDQKWDEAISRYTEAVKLDPNLGEAYLGWGYCLVGLKKYEEAIRPLRTAERLMPANPEVHHSLGTALERSGHKEEAQKEFAIHESLRSGAGVEKSE